MDNSFNQNKSLITDLILLCLLIGSLFAFALGNRPLNVPDEARYSEIPREMLVTHNFVTPRVNGIKYFEKPPLFYWMQAAALKTFGLNETACRLVDALMALLGCLATYLATRKLYNRKTAWYASIILATSVLYTALARVVTLDMTVTTFLSITMLAFIVGVQYEPGGTRRCIFYLMYIFAALAVMTKGLIGIVFPGTIILLWLIGTRQWRELKNCYLGTGLVLFLIIALPWHVLVQHANPEFFHFYIIDQHFLRFLTKDAGRYQPIYYYLPIVLLGLFPWTGFLYGALKRIRIEESKELYLLIWAAFVFVFYSISDSKLVPYVLPCIPPLAILIAKFFADLKNEFSILCAKPTIVRRDLWIGFLSTSVIGVIGIVAMIVALRPDVTLQYAQLKHWSLIVGLILSINIVLVPLLFWRRGFLTAFISQVVIIYIFYGAVCLGFPYVYTDSVKSFAVALKPILKPGDMVATYDYYYQDLPFYLQRTVTIVNWQSELAFGENHQDPGELMITDATFWPIWKSKRTVYLALSSHQLQVMQEQDIIAKNIQVIATEKNDVLIVNHSEQT